MTDAKEQKCLVANFIVTMADSTPKLAATALSLTVQDWNRLGLEDDPTFDATVERVTALLLVRIVALAVSNDDDQQDYSDFSTSTICRTALMQQEPWPDPITDSLILQLQQFVRVILQGYNDVPYHNFAHAYHVCLSTNKLIDLMWNKNNCSISATKSFGLREDALSLTALLFAALIHDVEHTGVVSFAKLAYCEMQSPSLTRSLLLTYYAAQPYLSRRR